MYEMFEKFGTALYLRRGMQKRAFYGKRAVDYLEKVGALRRTYRRTRLGKRF